VRQCTQIHMSQAWDEKGCAAFAAISHRKVLVKKGLLFMFCKQSYAVTRSSSATGKVHTMRTCCREARSCRKGALLASTLSSSASLASATLLAVALQRLQPGDE